MLCNDLVFKMHLFLRILKGDSLSDDKYLAASLLSPVTRCMGGRGQNTGDRIQAANKEAAPSLSRQGGE